jgi:hypothetical protein
VPAAVLAVGPWREISDNAPDKLQSVSSLLTLVLVLVYSGVKLLH